MLLLQEHKLSASQTSKCGKALPGRSHTYSEPSIGEQGRSKGVSTSIGAPLLQHIFGQGTLVPRRALWVDLDIEGKVGILNIYAPIDLRQTATFWSTLKGSIPRMDSWIVGRDFNKLKVIEDQHGRDLEFAGIARAKQSKWESFFFATGRRNSWTEPSFCRWPRSLDF